MEYALTLYTVNIHQHAIFITWNKPIQCTVIGLSQAMKLTHC